MNFIHIVEVIKLNVYKIEHLVKIRGIFSPRQRQQLQINLFVPCFPQTSCPKGKVCQVFEKRCCIGARVNKFEKNPEIH